MQVKDNSSISRKKYVLLGVVIKALITIVCLYFILHEFNDQSVDFSKVNWPSSLGWILAIVFLLMIVNWYLEALRWKVSLASFENIGIKEAWSSVLRGLALNWIMPFTSGDFAARILYRKDKIQTTSAMVLNRGIMLFLTFILGTFSLIYLPQTMVSINWIYLLLIILGVVLLFFFRKRAYRFFFYFQSINKQLIRNVILISVFRYVIFTYQFYLLLQIFNIEVSSVVLLAGIGWIFLTRSIIPHLLGGIGLREAASIVFFTALVSDITTIIIPVFLIWIINTVIPSIAGLVLIWKASELNRLLRKGSALES